MFRNITYFLIFGKPLIMYLGTLTLLSFLLTALIGFLNYKGMHKIPFKWHPRMAAISITLAIIHGLMGILAYIK
jgi:ethanolamine transporter EutH